MEHIIIAVNMESADIFSGFSDSYPEFSLPIEHKAFIGPNEIMEFIITLGPPALSALAAYLVARLQNAKKEIKIKKGEKEIELKGINITPDEVMKLLLKLEQKEQHE